MKVREAQARYEKSVKAKEDHKVFLEIGTIQDKSERKYSMYSRRKR